jgi:hypothetical protein
VRVEFTTIRASTPATAERIHTTISYRFDQPLADLRLLEGLRALTFSQSLRHQLSQLTFPHNLTSLDLGGGYNLGLDHVHWPPALSRFKIGSTFVQPLVQWNPPDSLLDLQFGDAYAGWNLPLDQLRLPRHLQRLSFSGGFNQPLDAVEFPASLTAIRFGLRFNQPLLTWSPPAGLRELDLGGWNRPVTDLILPSQLEILRVGNNFNHPVASLHLPATLRELRFGSAFVIRCMASSDLIDSSTSACSVPKSLVNSTQSLYLHIYSHRPKTDQ